MLADIEAGQQQSLPNYQSQPPYTKTYPLECPIYVLILR